MYTSHGHHIDGTIKDITKYRPPVARCGGPSLCLVCSKEAALNMRKNNMTIEPVKYVRKPFEIEAVQVTDDNLESVKEWCHGSIEKDTRPFVRVRVTRPLSERQSKAYVGDWVLYATTGFKVYTNKAFHRTFELADKPQELLTTSDKSWD